MVKLNHHYQKLNPTYLFTEIEKRISTLKQKSPNVILANLGIGDFTRPLFPSIAAALQESAKEMGEKESFRGYGPCEGYLFLREAIALNEYPSLKISPDEIFISDGANCDMANLQELFAVENKVAIADPTYPVYLDTNVMAGRTRHLLKTGIYGGVSYLPCTEENNFQPELPLGHVDLIYLCSPNNPTGVGMERALLKKWVDYAREHRAILLFDGAYEAYVQSPTVPRSIYEIEGAKEVAVEVRSFSKSAGFTGLRCSYTVIPHQLKVHDAGTIHSLHALWKRRHDTKFNGVAYPIQKAAFALYQPQGKQELKESVFEIMKQTKQLKEELTKLGYRVYGGVDAPYIWCKTPGGMKSWDFFDHLLEKRNLITIPGRGFGLHGEGFVRFSCFAPPETIQKGLLQLQSAV